MVRTDDTAPIISSGELSTDTSFQQRSPWFPISRDQVCIFNDDGSVEDLENELEKQPGAKSDVLPSEAAF